MDGHRGVATKRSVQWHEELCGDAASLWSYIDIDKYSCLTQPTFGMRKSVLMQLVLGVLE